MSSQGVLTGPTRVRMGLSGNAAFIVGRRAMTKGMNLGGRCFMHSYKRAF